MSNAVLVEVEEKIQNGFSDFENAVNDEDFELATSTADELLSLVASTQSPVVFQDHRNHLLQEEWEL